MIEIENIAKETQEALQTIAAGMTPACEETHPESQEDETMLPEDYRHTISDAISSLYEDICQHSNAIDNMARAGAVRILADAYKILASVQPVATVADLGMLQLMQGMKDYCTNCKSCDSCDLSVSVCDRLLPVAPQFWDLPGRVEDGKTEG